MLELPSRSSRFLGLLVVPVLSLLAVTPILPAEPRPLDGPISLFNGKDLTGWVNVNGAPKTWQVRDGMIVCTGQPTGFLRTDTMHENYVLELEWRHPHKGSYSGLVVHADALPRVGIAHPKAVYVQIKDGGHGSIAAFDGLSLVPLTKPVNLGGWGGAQPTEDRCRPAGEWNRYVLTAKDGALDLAVNGKVVTRVKECSQVKGYIGLLANGSETHFRNLRLTPLSSSHPPVKQIAQADEGFRSLFDGLSFAGWQYSAKDQAHWRVLEGDIRCDGKMPANRQAKDLWTEKEYGDFLLVADWRLPKKPEPKMLPDFTPDGLFLRDQAGKVRRHEVLDAGDSGIFLRGNTRSQVNIWSQPMGSGDINDYHKDAKLPIEIRRACVPRKKADNPPGEWNRFVITMRGDRVTVVLNGETVIEKAQLPGVPARGRLGLQNHGDPVEFRNLFIKTLN
jgi:hypothetical protein